MLEIGIMSKLKLLALIFLLAMAGGISAQDFREVKFTQVDSLMGMEPDTLHVINFWATWCKPCVAELPYFREASKKFEGQAVKFVFISLDFQGQIESKLVPFLQKDPLPGQSWWLNERKLNTMIDKVSPDWSGAIPFTILLKGNKQNSSFFEGELDQEILLKLIKEKL